VLEPTTSGNGNGEGLCREGVFVENIEAWGKKWLPKTTGRRRGISRKGTASRFSQGGGTMTDEVLRSTKLLHANREKQVMKGPGEKGIRGISRKRRRVNLRDGGRMGDQGERETRERGAGRDMGRELEVREQFLRVQGGVLSGFQRATWG